MGTHPSLSSIKLSRAQAENIMTPQIHASGLGERACLRERASRVPKDKHLRMRVWAASMAKTDSCPAAPAALSTALRG